MIISIFILKNAWESNEMRSFKIINRERKILKLLPMVLPINVTINIINAT